MIATLNDTLFNIEEYTHAAFAGIAHTRPSSRGAAVYFVVRFIFSQRFSGTGLLTVCGGSDALVRQTRATAAARVLAGGLHTAPSVGQPGFFAGGLITAPT